MFDFTFPMKKDELIQKFPFYWKKKIESLQFNFFLPWDSYSIMEPIMRQTEVSDKSWSGGKYGSKLILHKQTSYDGISNFGRRADMNDTI